MSVRSLIPKADSEAYGATSPMSANIMKVTSTIYFNGEMEIAVPA